MNTEQSNNQEGERPRKRRTAAQVKFDVREDAKAALERLRNSPDERLAQLRMQRVEGHITDLFNPLGEAKVTQLLPQEYSLQEGARRMVTTDRRAKIFTQLLLAIDPRKEPHAHAPVIPLALMVPSVERFVALLPWARSSFAPNASDPIGLEAIIWGRGLPKAQEVQGFLQSYAHIASIGVEGVGSRAAAARALIQRDGLVQLEVALYKAMQRLYALNPLPTWRAESITDVGGQVAGRAYMQSVAPYVPQQFQGVLKDLAAIMWNRDCITPRDDRLSVSSASPFELAALSLRAAVLNNADAEVLAQLGKCINHCTNSKSTTQLVASSLQQILGRIGLESASPQGRFLAALVHEAHSVRSGTTALKKAWLSIAKEFERSALRGLSCVESITVEGVTPKQAPLRCVTDIVTRDTLATALSDYGAMVRNSLPMQMLTCGGSFTFAWDDNKHSRTISASEISALQPLSTILAGIPRLERQRLLNACG